MKSGKTENSVGFEFEVSLYQSLTMKPATKQALSIKVLSSILFKITIELLFYV